MSGRAQTRCIGSRRWPIVIAVIARHMRHRGRRDGRCLGGHFRHRDHDLGCSDAGIRRRGHLRGRLGRRKAIRLEVLEAQVREREPGKVFFLGA